MHRDLNKGIMPIPQGRTLEAEGGVSAKKLRRGHDWCIQETARGPVWWESVQRGEQEDMSVQKAGASPGAPFRLRPGL